MKPIAEQLAFYRSYHRTLGCRVTHAFGVPLVTFAILIPMGWVTLRAGEWRLSLAEVFVVGTLAYYFRLDRLLAILMALCMIPVTVAALWVAGLPFKPSLAVFGSAFVLGWVLQLLGHKIEGRRPALLDNFFQAVFTAPLFLLAEALMAMGWRKLPPE